MVDNFLSWKLPSDFSPDGGISYEPYTIAPKWRPMGTNLFHAGQAKAMIEAMLDGAVSDGDAEPDAYMYEYLFEKATEQGEINIWYKSSSFSYPTNPNGMHPIRNIQPLYLHPPQLAERVKELEATIAKLTEANAKLREALNNINETAQPYNDGAKFAYISSIAIEALSTTVVSSGDYKL
jgi:hypothetical protein